MDSMDPMDHMAHPANLQALLGQLFGESPSIPHMRGKTEEADVFVWDLPGLDPSALRIENEGGFLALYHGDEENRMAYVQLPKGIPSDEITADLKWGRLTVTVPFPNAKVTEIRVNILD